MPRDQQPPRRKRKAHHYWWVLANTLALCLAILSWVLCLHIFGHPEIPRNYELLRKLGRTAPPVGFSLEEAPPGEAADPRALYRRYAELDPDATDRLNASLMRNYLTQLDERGLIQYVEGDFRVSETRELDDDDLFHPGFAVRAQAMVQPDPFTEAAPWPVVIDYLFPTSETQRRDWFRPGDQLQVSKIPNCALLLHVEQTQSEDTPLVILTVAPIAMGDYQVGQEHRFSIAAPESLNPAAAFPVFAPEGEAE